MLDVGIIISLTAILIQSAPAGSGIEVGCAYGLTQPPQSGVHIDIASSLPVVGLSPGPLIGSSRDLTGTLEAGVEPGRRDYSIVVHGAEQNFIPIDPPFLPGEGKKWILVVATLSNLGGDPVIVSTDSLTLIGRDRIRFTPDPPDELTQPALIGTRLEAGDWKMGMVRFEVPMEAIGDALEWCPATVITCTLPLQSPIPYTPSVVN